MGFREAKVMPPETRPPMTGMTLVTPLARDVLVIVFAKNRRTDFTTG